MKVFCVLLLLFCSCATVSKGVVFEKLHNYDTRITFVWDHSLETSYDIPEHWIIYIKDNNGNIGKCITTKTMHDIMNVGDYFDCEIMGIEAMESEI